MYFEIKKITSDNVVDFAAEELKKYLRMMMPRCGDVSIKYDPLANDGFRLGVMSEFGLDTSDAEDITLDDIIYIDTDEKGGIIAGSNVRSVLLAVYRFLRENGCRWLYPGSDGDCIPIKELEPIKYRKLADCRYRGWCNEGAEFQQCMLEAIDIAPKLGMNVFMLEFDNPKAYYNNYYDHLHNEANRDPEPVSAEMTLQWKRECEAEIKKRGLIYQDMGHGWTADPIGIDSSDGWAGIDESKLSEESRSMIAMIGGERKLFCGSPLTTQLCMSNHKASHLVAKAVADYGEVNTCVDYIHVWLADFVNNHCECEECRKMMPWDWYITLLNEIDEEMTARGLGSKVVFACYTEMLYVSDKVKLKNPDRFSLLVAPISRSYYEAIPEKPKHIEPAPYTLNKLIMPPDIDTYLLQTRRQVETYKVTNTMVYEYHFCFNQYFNPGNMDYARMLYKDVKAYKINGMKGIIQDGTQRNYYPNTFLLYVYAETLFDTSVDFDTMVEDYYSHAYGEVWRDVVELFERIGGIVPVKFMCGKASLDKKISRVYDPSMEKPLLSLSEECERYIAFAKENKVKKQRYRSETVSFKLLENYLIFWSGLSKILAVKCTGEDEIGASVAFHDFFDGFCKCEPEFERFCDHLGLAYAYADRYFHKFRKDIPIEDLKKNDKKAEYVGGIIQE